MEVSTGLAQDVSILLCFVLWDIVYCTRYANKQPGSQKFVGFAFDVGHALTFLVLTDDTRKVIKCSVLRLAELPENKIRMDQNSNLQLDKAAGETIKQKVNFCTTGRDPCLAEGFIMQTLVPDADAMNDVSLIDEQDDDDSVEDEKDVHASIDDVPKLPENMDEELVQPMTRDDSDDFLRNHRYRRKKKDRFQGSHHHDCSLTPERRRSSRLCRNANLMDVLDPVKSKLDGKIEAHQQSRSSNQKPDPSEKRILESEGERDYGSSMMNPSLKDEEEKVWSNEDQSMSAEHLKFWQPGADNHLQEPIRFHKKSLHTLNPTEKGLTPKEMVGRTFLVPPSADGSCHRAKIMSEVRKMTDKAHESPECIQFKCLVNNDFEEIVAHNDVLDFIEKDSTWDGVWTFEKILAHQKVKSGDKNHQGSGINCLVLWSAGEQTWEPLCNRTRKSGLWIDDPVTVASYARDNGLLDEPKWKLPGLKKMAKTQKKPLHLVNKAKLHSFCNKPVYMYGFQAPRNHVEAMDLDHMNGNTMWRDAEMIEMNQIDEHKSFIDKGVGYNPGSDFKRIRVQWCTPSSMMDVTEHDSLPEDTSLRRILTQCILALCHYKESESSPF